MNNFFIIFGVLILMILFNKKEYFNHNNSEELKQKKCENTTDMMSEINMYVDKTCQDDSSTNRIMNNNRLTCRDFENKQIFVGNDNKKLCNEKNVIPVKKLKGDFIGLNKLSYDGEKPLPNGNGNSESEFPFDLNAVAIDIPNLDNKN
jgi:hypothetical protein